MIVPYVAICVLLLPCIMFKMKHGSESDRLFERLDTTAIRGVSAVFVVVAHYSIWFNELSDRRINSIVMIPLEQLGGIGVLLFFFVSGYGINEAYGSKTDMRAFLGKRFWGVYFPYVLMKVITNLMLIIGGVESDPSNLLLSYVKILLVPDWFIFVIILQYISYYCSRKYFARNDLVFSIIADVVMTVSFILLHKPIGWFNALWLFTFGIFVSKHQSQIISVVKKRYFTALLSSFLGFCILGGLFAMFKGHILANFAKPLAGMLLCIALCCIFRKITMDNPVVIWFGKRSMYVYIVHIAVWEIISKKTVDYTLVLCVSIVLSVLLTEGIYRLVSIATNSMKNGISKHHNGIKVG